MKTETKEDMMIAGTKADKSMMMTGTKEDNNMMIAGNNMLAKGPRTIASLYQMCKDDILVQ